MPKCTLKKNAIEINTQAAVTVVNGYVIKVSFDPFHGHVEGWLDQDGYDTSKFAKADADAAAGAKVPGAVRYIVTRDLADCVVVAQQADVHGVLVTHFAHLSSHQYAPDGKTGALGDHGSVPRMEVKDFKTTHHAAKDIELTNVSLARVRAHHYMQTSHIPCGNMHTVGGGAAHVDCVLDIEHFRLYPAYVEGDTCDWGTSDASTYHSFSTLDPKTYKKNLDAMKKVDAQAGKPPCTLF